MGKADELRSRYNNAVEAQIALEYTKASILAPEGEPHTVLSSICQRRMENLTEENADEREMLTEVMRF